MSKQIQIYVDDTYFDLVPRPSKDQRKALKESIKNEGQHEPIIVDETGRILDGHTRFEICQELHLKPQYIIRKFDDEETKKNFAVTVNLKRRHLNDFQIYELFEKQIDMIREQNVKKRGEDIWKTRNGDKPKMTYKEKYASATSQKASELTGLGRGVVESIQYIKRHADKKLIQEVRDGNIGISKAKDKLLRNVIVRSDKGTTYRSKIGITYDVIRSIKESDQRIKVSQICRKANLSHYSAVEVLKQLESVNLVEHKKESIVTRYYNEKSSFIYYIVTPKGQEFFNACQNLYSYLPKEFEGR